MSPHPPSPIPPRGGSLGSGQEARHVSVGGARPRPLPARLRVCGAAADTFLGCPTAARDAGAPLPAPPPQGLRVRRREGVPRKAGRQTAQVETTEGGWGEGVCGVPILVWGWVGGRATWQGGGGVGASCHLVGGPYGQLSASHGTPPGGRTHPFFHFFIFFSHLLTWHVCHLSFADVAGGVAGGGAGIEKGPSGRGD